MVAGALAAARILRLGEAGLIGAGGLAACFASGLHWVLDVVMNEDQARNRLDNGPNNLAVLRHMALNLMRKENSKGCLRGKFKRAAWRDDFLAKLIAQI